MLLKSSDRLESGNIELLIIGTMGALHVGVVFPLPLADAQELDSEEVKGSFLQPSQLGQALPSELLPPIGLEEELMSKVFTIKDTEPFQVLPSGHTAWLLASVGNLSVQIIESKTAGQPVEFPAPSGEEEFIYVLRGHVQYDDGRTARMGEAVYNPPDLSSPSKYSGQLLRIAVFTESRGTQPRKDLLGMVFNVDNVKSFYDDKAMTTRRLWVVTQNMSIVMNESQPGTRFVDTGHPEKEIIYVIRGCLEYDNGRTVTDGEAVVNLPDKLHPGRRCGTAPTRSFEAKTPAPERLLEMFEA